MKLIIAGSRNMYVPEEFLCYLIYNVLNINPKEIVSGVAQGIDTCGEDFAAWNNTKLKQFPANWNEHGKAAGPIRNQQMAEYADALLLIWDGESKGSADMLARMKVLNKPIYEIIIKKHD